jgi:hypothetical protein
MQPPGDTCNGLEQFGSRRNNDDISRSSFGKVDGQRQLKLVCFSSTLILRFFHT